MKAIVFTIFILNFSIINGQSIKANKYINNKLGISIYFDSTWSLSYTARDSMFSADNFSKTELVTFHYIKPQHPIKVEKYTVQQLGATKAAYKQKYESEEHSVLSISARNDRFMNYDCFVTIALLKGKDYMEGIPFYKTQISFMTTNGYLVSYIYLIPEKIYNPKEISYVEEQLKTFRELK